MHSAVDFVLAVSSVFRHRSHLRAGFKIRRIIFGAERSGGAVFENFSGAERSGRAVSVKKVGAERSGGAEISKNFEFFTIFMYFFPKFAQKGLKHSNIAPCRRSAPLKRSKSSI